MSELSDISTEIAATRRSPTDNTMMAGGTEKQTTSSSFSERMRNTLGNIFPFTMGGGAGNEGESPEEEDEEEQVDFGSQVSLNSSTQENEAYVGRRDWNHGQIWCSENDKQRGKRTGPVKRLRDYDKFRAANWGE